MRKLAAAALIVFGLDLVVLALMVRDLLVAEFGPTGRVLAAGFTEATGGWLLLVGLILVAGWWRDSRLALWLSLICGALPLLWAWSLAVQAITEWAAAAQ